jgi:dephospho-CoA kinase
MIYKIQTEFGEEQINTDSEADAKRIADQTTAHRKTIAKINEINDRVSNESVYESFFHNVNKLLTPPQNYEI